MSLHKSLEFFVPQVNFTTSLFPFMFTLPNLFSLSNCLLNNILHIFQVDFFHAHTHLNFIHGMLTCLWHSMIKTNSWNNYKSSHDTIKVSTIMREFQLAPLSLTYAMTLFVKLNSANKTFICFTKVALEVSGVSNSPIIMWQGTKLWWMKLINKANVSYPNLVVHRSNVAITVAH